MKRAIAEGVNRGEERVKEGEEEGSTVSTEKATVTT